ncbi:outer membrane transport energization protein TonB [Methylovorus glucosotrophus]|uniref:energy transducer TonB n=1 Tax=Methylovorus glucosotrophus TaxID=266009 RepID=UPI001331417A|nr:energy transducer TonB [Methylovorus glucosotrophus]KAF0835984.1 outer membrane transport energization protein TonB [Methylovorus glucosotrophus]
MSSLSNSQPSYPSGYTKLGALPDIEENLSVLKDAVARAVSDGGERFGLYRNRALEQLESSSKWMTQRNSGIVALVVIAHIVGISAYLESQRVPPKPPAPKEVVIEFIKPAPKIEPEKKIEPPPPPPPPKVERKPQPAKPVQALKTAPAEPDIKPSDMTVQENTTVQHTPEPVQAVPMPPPAPPAPKEEPLTEAVGYAGYLNNPPPEYPAFAQRQGWEGKVILRVRVLASGKPGAVEVKQSSGRKTLDEAALEVVKNWVFAPAKRGSTPVDGWATVPIEFRLAK